MWMHISGFSIAFRCLCIFLCQCFCHEAGILWHTWQKNGFLTLTKSPPPPRSNNPNITCLPLNALKRPPKGTVDTCRMQNWLLDKIYGKGVVLGCPALCCIFLLVLCCVVSFSCHFDPMCAAMGCYI